LVSQNNKASSRFHESVNSVRGKFEAFNFVVRNKIFGRYWRSKLRNQDFSIICNNCIAGAIYQKFGLPYSTPTVGLFFFADDYIEFLQNFEVYIQQQLSFVESSRHPEANIALRKERYPIGILGDHVEIHFLHYKDENEAAEKWNRRKERINLNNLFFIYSDRDNFREIYLDTYEKLHFEHKIFLSSKPRGKSDLVVFVRDYQEELQVGLSQHNGKYEKYIDIVKWLNGKPDFIKNI
jgi:uncharacterized protein (DUF1919 family)